ncbi:Kinesin light chain 3 [Hondaea fermentalgiana]|uniref:Kinesin light chain 3 n=1 Tax=Hondaea fermentalgiana TaxID=2315210 RepID=A0A2R5GIL0_9STRA|nr:Kinesin light chain 3 [Hondaea fermentalgiana]|eukprot:GBG30435.1 Kinesin light chain 3 [Hondaea fermentalgiana]
MEDEIKEAITRRSNLQRIRISFTRKADDEIFSEDARRIVDPRCCAPSRSSAVLSGETAIGVELYVVTRDLSDKVKKGATIQVLRIRANGKLHGRVQYVGVLITFEPGKDADPKPRQDWSTEVVAEHVVLALTKSLPQAHSTSARKCRFQDLVAALEDHFLAKTPFIWLDLFCANQPLLISADEDLPPKVVSARNQCLTHGSYRAIGRFGSAVIFFDRWDVPAPLQRAWCVWEIMGAITRAQSFQVVFAPGQEQILVQVLLEDVDGLATVMADNNNMRNAECWKKEDKEMIDKAIETAVEDGYGEYIEALQMLEEALSIRKESLGDRHPYVATTLNNIAYVYKAKGRYEEALTYWEEALSILKESLGDRHPYVAAVLESIQGTWKRMT